MGRRPLHVEQGRTVELQELDRRPARDLRRVGDPVEHRLAREEPADADAVQPADERAVLPRLDRVRPAELVQPRVRVDERRVDPTVRSPRVGAPEHDVDERGVDADLEAADRAAQRAAAVEAVERDDPARIGRPPRERAPGVHREQSPAVRREQRARLEIGADRDDLVVAGRRVGVGEVPDARRRFDRHLGSRPSTASVRYASNARAIWPTWISSVPA